MRALLAMGLSRAGLGRVGSVSGRRIRSAGRGRRQVGTLLIRRPRGGCRLGELLHTLPKLREHHVGQAERWLLEKGEQRRDQVSLYLDLRRRVPGLVHNERLEPADLLFCQLGGLGGFRLVLLCSLEVVLCTLERKLSRV